MCGDYQEGALGAGLMQKSFGAWHGAWHMRGMVRETRTMAEGLKNARGHAPWPRHAPWPGFRIEKNAHVIVCETRNMADAPWPKVHVPRTMAGVMD
jgi:hypothetical protein